MDVTVCVAIIAHQKLRVQVKGLGGQWGPLMGISVKA